MLTFCLVNYTNDRCAICTICFTLWCNFDRLVFDLVFTFSHNKGTQSWQHKGAVYVWHQHCYLIRCQQKVRPLCCSAANWGYLTITLAGFLSEDSSRWQLCLNPHCRLVDASQNEFVFSSEEGSWSFIFLILLHQWIILKFNCIQVGLKKVTKCL